MTQKTYIVEGRQFRTQSDYSRALHDSKIIRELRRKAAGYDRKQLLQLKADIQKGKYKFFTVLGQDFADEVDELLKEPEKAGLKKKSAKGRNAGTGAGGKPGLSGRKELSEKQKESIKKPEGNSGWIEAYVQEELEKRERRRKILLLLCSVLAVCCIGYFGVYSYFDYKTSASYNALSRLKEKPVQPGKAEPPVIHYTTGNSEPKEVLDEYKNLLNKNKKLIGWLKIDDTNINYPVMQTTDNEYYLDHNLNQEYDKNGSIFMDKDCDVLKPSTNLILYGHHMKSGQMFGDLDMYSSEDYFKEHRYIRFDTIYEKGLWEVMYVFRSKVYSEEEIVFKYYQFIDALSEQEFNSNMQEMAALSIYDTGVTAQYGDRLLTLSTCDYQEKNGRFVVVAKKAAKE